MKNGTIKSKKGRECSMITLQEIAQQELNLKGKDFLTLADFSPEEILALLDKAKKIKETYTAGDDIHL